MGFGGQCPSPTYKSNGNCCCGNGCCWNRCTLDNPPDNCLEGVIKGQWMFDTNKGYFIAVKYWNGSGMNMFLKISKKKDSKKYVGVSNLGSSNSNTICQP